jgi:hypothetical protein
LSSFHLVISFWYILIHMWKFAMFFILQHFFIFLSLSSFTSLFHLFVIFLHILWILTNFSLKLMTCIRIWVGSLDVILK